MSEIHATAIIADGAELGERVKIGPYCVVGDSVRIEDDAVLHSHVVVEGQTEIGAGCQVFAFACIGSQTQDLKYRGGSSHVSIGAGTTLREYVTVNSGTHEGEHTVVGSNCHIMAYCHVAHACRVGDEVIMANGATLAGDVEVGSQAVIGGLSGVHQFCKIGCLCMVGGCTKIVKDCPPFMMVDGNPAAVRGLNVLGLERRGYTKETRAKLKQAYKCLYRQSLPVKEALAKIQADTGLVGDESVMKLTEFINTSDRGILK